LLSPSKNQPSGFYGFRFDGFCLSSSAICQPIAAAVTTTVTKTFHLMNQGRGSQFFSSVRPIWSENKITAKPLSLADYRLLLGDGNGWNRSSRKEVGEITDFTEKVGTVGGKPPTVPDFPDTHPYYREWNQSHRFFAMIDGLFPPVVVHVFDH
jgi:hypothetical protein